MQPKTREAEYLPLIKVDHLTLPCRQDDSALIQCYVGIYTVITQMSPQRLTSNKVICPSTS